MPSDFSFSEWIDSAFAFISSSITTPQGLITFMIAAFIVVTLVIATIVYFIAGLFHREKRAPAPQAAVRDPLTEPEGLPQGEGPIGLARLRDAAITGMEPAPAAEPQLLADRAEVSAPQTNVQEPSLASASVQAEPKAETPSEPVLSAPPEETPSPEPPVLRPATPSEAERIASTIVPAQSTPRALGELLLTLPFRSRPELTTLHADACGMSIEAIFFPAEVINAIASPVTRLIPFLPAEQAEILFSESDRRTFRSGKLFAQPDAVINTPGGLVSLEYKSKGGREDDRGAWLEKLREKDMLQALINAMVLSAETERPAAAILRTHNAVYFLRPSKEVRRFIEAGVEEADRFLRAFDAKRPSGVSASEYAGLLAVPFASLFPKPRSAGSIAGEAAHKAMLER